MRESGSGLWPTPLSSDATHGGPNQRDGKGRPYLSGAVHNWPTPRANDAEKRGSIDAENPRNGLVGAVKRWPTPTRSDGMGGPGCSGRDGGDNLRTAVAYPTPCAQDAKNYTLPVSQTDRGSIPGHLLRSGEQPGGQLNPDWVEWLMGWCPFFTSLDPVDPVLFRLWRWLSENDKRWIQGSAKEIPGQSMQCMWFYGEVESSSFRPEPSQQCAGKHSDTMHEMSRQGTSMLGQSSGCCHCEMCRMRQEFPTPTDAALINLLGSMSFRAWQAERQKEVGGKRNKKDMCLVWQAICFRESPTNNLLSLMWEQARLGQTYWKIDPADLGIIPRTGTKIPDRCARLKAIGNGQCPQCMAEAFRLLMGRLP